MTIIRTATTAKGGVTPEELLLMEKHRDLWISRSLRTDPIEPEKIIPAIEGIYAAAGLKKPTVVIVPSPLVMAFSYGAAVAILAGAKKPLVKSRPKEKSLENAAARACYELAGKKGIEHAAKWNSSYQGGNMWAANESYLTAFRDIIGIKIPQHEKYHYWEQAAIHGGFRVMHEKFCMVSDFPVLIKTDNENLPHCEDGPTHKWRDGWSLYHWHGTVVPEEWVINRESLTLKVAFSQEDIGKKNAAFQMIGYANILAQLNDGSTKVKGPKLNELINAMLDGGVEEFSRVLNGE